MQWHSPSSRANSFESEALPAADLSRRLTWSGRLRLSTQRCSFKLHFDQCDGSWMLLHKHAEARASRSFSRWARHRRTPHIIEGSLLPRWSIEQREWLDELMLREFHEGGMDHRAASDGPKGLTYTSVELNGWHTRLSSRCAGLINGRDPASVNTKVFSRHLAGAAGDELVVHARPLS